MKTMSLLDAAKLISPNPVSLVCSRTPDGVTNLATISWWAPLSVEPEMLGFAMMKSSFSGETIRASKNAILTIPGEGMERHVMECGSSTGRTKNKVKDFGIAMKSLPDCDIMIPERSVVAVQCELQEFISTGDHYFHVFKVKQVYGDEDIHPLFAWKGYAKIAPVQK